MAHAGTVDEVREALAAFEQGRATLAELESVLGAALKSGSWTPEVAMQALHSAVAAGRVPLEVLRRLGLEELSDATVARVPRSSSTAGESAAAQPVPQASHEPI